VVVVVVVVVVITADGFTIPERAVIEHNMVAASRVYDNIRFSELGRSVSLHPPPNCGVRHD